MIDEGRLTAEEAVSRPGVLLLKALTGSEPSAALDLRLHDAHPGDRYPLCSDGLSSVLPGDRVRERLGSSGSPQQTVSALVGAAKDGLFGAPYRVLQEGEDPAGRDLLRVQEPQGFHGEQPRARVGGVLVGGADPAGVRVGAVTQFQHGGVLSGPVRVRCQVGDQERGEVPPYRRLRLHPRPVGADLPGGGWRNGRARGARESREAVWAC
jgi:hypothetical protein